MTPSRLRFVGIANGSYIAQKPLERAVPDAQALAAVLQERHEYEPFLLRSLERGALLNQIEQCLGDSALTDGSLIVAWIGHGKIGPDRSLRFLGYAADKDVEVGTAGQLGEWAARTGARQVLIIVDTCYAGGGVVEAAKLAEAVNNGRASAGVLWFGVLAASLEDEPSRSGALVREIIRLLRDGPRNADFRWDKTRPYIRGDDLVQTLLNEWSEPRQQPHPISVGKAWDLVRNPRFEAGIPAQPVEHLLLAARGGSGEEIFFSGRDDVLREIVAWLHRREPGLFVLTGPPGCGKSAVAGRIVSLSSSQERARILAAEQLPPERDPGANSIHAHLHARGVTVERASEILARQLNLSIDGGQFGLLAEARRRRKLGDTLVVVIDGLDEAHAFSSNIAVELVAPLARDALVLVATRDAQNQKERLIAQLGPATRLIDLGQDVDGTKRDVRAYVKRRLAGIAVVMDADLVADQVAHSGGDSSSSSFLLARLVTSQLRVDPVNTAVQGWPLTLASSVETALERDLQSVVLDISGTSYPTAARDMMRALVFAYGAGFPADDIWPAVASATSTTGATYTREHAYTVLSTLGRHLVAAYEGDQPVYRIAHQQLVDYLKKTAPITGDGRVEVTAAAVADAILRVYEETLDVGLGREAHHYLWRHAWRHLAEGDPNNLAGLRRLAARDRGAFLADLSSGLELSSTNAFAAGLYRRALGFIEEAVAARREIGDELKLAMALFHLTVCRLTIGDVDGANDAAREAATAARTLGERPESRIVLTSSLLARGLAQLRDGRYQAAKILADEAIALGENQSGVGPSERWAELAPVYALAGQVALALSDLGAAEARLYQALDLAEPHRDTALGGGLFVETLSLLAMIENMRATFAAPDSNGTYAAVKMTAAERLLREHNEKDSQTAVTAVAQSRAILALVRAHLLNRSRGLAAPDDGELRRLLDKAIALVTSLAQESVDAAAIHAYVLVTRALLLDRVDAQAAIADRNHAEQALRRFAANNVLAGNILGELLTLKVAPALHVVTNAAPQDLQVYIATLQEAIALLRNGTGIFRYALSNALTYLTHFLAFSGQNQEQTLALRAEAIEVTRSLVRAAPDALPLRAQLAGLLADQASGLLDRSLVEAAEAAREALTLSSHLPKPQFGSISGTAAVNLAAAEIGLGHAAETRAYLREAIQDLEPLTPHPIYVGVLATAYINLTQVELDSGSVEEALRLARRAVALFETPGLPPVTAVNKPLALLALGRAERAAGLADVGSERLRGLIDGFTAAVKTGELDEGRFAAILNAAAPDMWDDALSAMSDRPDLRLILTLQRWPSDEEKIAPTVLTLIEALTNAPPSRIALIRSIARAQRSRNSALFDAAWRSAAGTIPQWLEVEPMQGMLLVAWLTASTPMLSRDYLKSHPRLLEPGSDVILEELALAGGAEELVDLHRNLLETARELGADEAYAPILATNEIDHWISSDDPEEYLMAHPELLRPEIAAILGAANDPDPRWRGFSYIVELAQRGESRLAFQAMKDPASALDYLQPAWRSIDVARLKALASVIQIWSRDANVYRKATTAIAIALALEDHTDAADALVAEALGDSGAADRDELAEMIGDAIKYHLKAALALARLVERIATQQRQSTADGGHPAS